MGYRDKGDRSREDRDRRPPLANWSSAAEFGDATIDRPTPLNGRRDRAGRGSERIARQPDRRSQRPRSDAADWATITPVEDQRDDDFQGGGRYPDDDYRDGGRYPDDYRDGGRYPDDYRDGGRYPDDYRDTPSPRDDTASRVSRTTSDEPPRQRSRYPDDEPAPYDAGSRRSYDGDPPPAYDEPRRSRRSIEESPRRSRRAAEESVGQPRDDEPRRLRRVDDEEERRFRRRDDEDDFGRPDISDLAAPREWSVSEPRSRHYRDDSDGGSWHTRQTTEVETWRTENAGAQRWRSEALSWRTRETIEIDPSDIGSVGIRAIGSSASGTAPQARHADTADLETWRSETGTWRTRDTATTDSWRMPPSSDDASSPYIDPGSLYGDTGSLYGDTGERRTDITPETGSWSRSRGQWVPGTDDTGEQVDFRVRRYDDTGELPKNLLEAGGRILDHDEFSEPRPRGDSSPGRRRAVEDDRAGERSDEWLGRRSADRFEEQSDERSDGDRPDTAPWSRAGTRGSRRALSSRFEDLNDGYRDVDEEPGRRSRYPHDEDDAPRFRGGRPSGGGRRTGRHASDGYDNRASDGYDNRASDGYDNDDERRPARTRARRTPVYAGPRGVADSVITPRAATSRGELARVGRRPTVDEDDEDDVEEVAYGYAGAGFASVAWFGLPIGAFLLWAVFLGGTARADCVDAGGRPCPAPREAAFTTFAAHVPQVGVAIVLSVIVALLIRLVSPFWRPATVGFAASVVGGGLTTVLFTVLNGG